MEANTEPAEGQAHLFYIIVVTSLYVKPREGEVKAPKDHICMCTPDAQEGVKEASVNPCENMDLCKPFRHMSSLCHRVCTVILDIHLEVTHYLIPFRPTERCSLGDVYLAHESILIHG